MNTSETTLSPFHQALREIGELHDRKQADYGTDADPFANVRASEQFGIPGWLGAVLRGNDKMSRLKTFAVKGTLQNETVEDSLLDLAVYSLIALVLFREGYRKNRTTHCSTCGERACDCECDHGPV